MDRVTGSTAVVSTIALRGCSSMRQNRPSVDLIVSSGLLAGPPSLSGRTQGVAARRSFSTARSGERYAGNGDPSSQAAVVNAAMRTPDVQDRLSLKIASYVQSAKSIASPRLAMLRRGRPLSRHESVVHVAALLVGEVGSVSCDELTLFPFVALGQASQTKTCRPALIGRLYFSASLVRKPASVAV